jgi:hypothetical protein
LDFAVADASTNNIGIFLASGSKPFGGQITFFVGNDSHHPMSLAVGDINNDSQTDIVVANSMTNNIVVLMAYGNGWFSTSITYPMGRYSQPVSIAVGDFNRDDRLDLVVANFGTNNVCKHGIH